MYPSKNINFEFTFAVGIHKGHLKNQNEPVLLIIFNIWLSLSLTIMSEYVLVYAQAYILHQQIFSFYLPDVDIVIQGKCNISLSWMKQWSSKDLQFKMGA